MKLLGGGPPEEGLGVYGLYGTMLASGGPGSGPRGGGPFGGGRVLLMALPERGCISNS